MKIKSFKCSPCEIYEISDFIEKWHYSGNVNGVICDYCFKLVDEKNNLIGAMIYGKIAMANVWKKYAKNIEDLTELRRLCCIDETPKNTESFFIARTIDWIKKNTDIKKILSYADSTHGHTGVIYQASNFKKLGKTNPGKMILYNGKNYHDKTIRTKYNGELKPFALKIKKALKNGGAKYIKTKGKYIYLYNINRKRNCKIQQELF